jgi:hypothetical protein
VEDFTYDEKNDSYECPCGNVLECIGSVTLRNNSGKRYQAERGCCAGCPKKDKCVSGKGGKNPVRTLYVIDRKHADNLSEKMKEKIDNPAYRSRRMQIIEPVYADITYCKGMNRFTMRTRKKAGIQWKLYCIVHNIGKCVRALGETYG